jgi:hypothetical protein
MEFISFLAWRPLVGTCCAGPLFHHIGNQASSTGPGTWRTDKDLNALTLQLLGALNRLQ